VPLKKPRISLRGKGGQTNKKDKGKDSNKKGREGEFQSGGFPGGGRDIFERKEWV